MILGRATAWLTLSVVLASGLALADPAPKIQFDKTVCDLGRTSLVQRVSGKFIMRNTGDAFLKLDPPAPSCSCIQARLSTDILQPGEQGELTFTINLASARMQIDKHITVTSNDPQNPKVNLGVKLDYVPLYDLLPMYLILGDVRRDTATNATVLVKRTDGRKLTLSKVEPSGSWIAAKLSPSTNADEQSGRVFIELNPKGAPRHFTESVRVFSETSNAPAFTIPIYGRVVGDVACTPESLYWVVTDAALLRDQPAETLVTRRLVVTATRPDRLVEVRNATSTMKELKIEVVAKQKGKSYEIVARLIEVPATSTTGTITFETSVPDEPRISVPVTIKVPAKK